jgi:hypothetical protein
LPSEPGRDEPIVFMMPAYRDFNSRQIISETRVASKEGPPLSGRPVFIALVVALPVLGLRFVAALLTALLVVVPIDVAIRRRRRSARGAPAMPWATWDAQAR